MWEAGILRMGIVGGGGKNRFRFTMSRKQGQPRGRRGFLCPENSERKIVLALTQFNLDSQFSSKEILPHLAEDPFEACSRFCHASDYPRSPPSQRRLSHFLPLNRVVLSELHCGLKRKTHLTSKAGSQDAACTFLVPRLFCRALVFL